MDRVCLLGFFGQFLRVSYKSFDCRWNFWNYVLRYWYFRLSMDILKKKKRRNLRNSHWSDRIVNGSKFEMNVGSHVNCDTTAKKKKMIKKPISPLHQRKLTINRFFQSRHARVIFAMWCQIKRTMFIMNLELLTTQKLTISWLFF